VAIQRPIPEPGQWEVRLKVIACGVCHGDTVTKYNVFKTGFPRIPGHEIYASVDKLGPGVTEYKEGDHVGVGWFGGVNCGGHCNSCSSGHRVCCEQGLVTGAHLDGGYAEFVIVREHAISHLPAGLSPEKAAPLMCAGLTMFNSLRNSKARPNDLVVISGIGGLGHLGIQYAAKMGFRVVATSRDSSKKDLALKLGAHHYIDSSKEDVTAILKSLGGVNLVIYTATGSKGLAQILPALNVTAEVFMVAALHEPLSIDSNLLLSKRASLRGWCSGDNKEAADTISFSVLTNVYPMVEVFPFSQANEAFDRMMSTKAEFRVVLSGGWDKVNVQ